MNPRTVLIKKLMVYKLVGFSQHHYLYGFHENELPLTTEYPVVSLSEIMLEMEEPRGEFRNGSTGDKQGRIN